MHTIRKLDDIIGILKQEKVKKQIALACAEDENALDAVRMAGKQGFASFIIIGDREKILCLAGKQQVNLNSYRLIHEPNPEKATQLAVQMCKDGTADAIMKGSVGTDVFLKSVLNKQSGLMIKNARMSYVCALEIPAYNKLLLVSDTAVVPYPDLDQKKQMIEYSINLANKLGINRPKVALIGASEKPAEIYHYTNDYGKIIELADSKHFGDCIIDGPLDVFLACHPQSTQIKKHQNKIMGEADVLIFPSLESANSFYKGLMLFANAKLAGLIQGTIKPVIVMSRSESPQSKLYCMALACLMA